MGTRERRSRSQERDLLLSQLFEASGVDSQKMAIAAVGSYGRGELTQDQISISSFSIPIPTRRMN